MTDVAKARIDKEVWSMLIDWLKESKYTVIFSGAGMSTESGVPDFRSASGYWQGKDPQALASIHAMEHNTNEFVDFYRLRIKLLDNIQPHHGYSILTTWSETLHLKSVITQNTDGLHEQAGNPNVIPIHGTIRQLHCHDCKKIYSTDTYFTDNLNCECGGFIRPSVILFGESLNEMSLAHAEHEAKNADLFIVLGSSLVVSPANSFPIIAKDHGAKLVIVNRDPTPLDPLADLVINDRRIGDYLREISGLLD